MQHHMHSSPQPRNKSNLHDGRDSRSSSLYYWPKAGQSGSTISSNATASNLPRTGRVLGLAYDAMGNALVSQISRLVLRFGRTRKQRRLDGTTNEKKATECGDSDSHTDTDSTATASNLPGTGRVIGLAYDKVGRVLVKRINQMAIKFGRGPDATAARIREHHNRLMRHKLAESREIPEHTSGALVLASQSRPVRKDLKLLLKYARSDITSTQMQAFEQIKELSISGLYIRQLLIELNASRDLGLAFMGAQGVREDDSRIALLSRARRALVAVSDVTIYGLGTTLENVTFMNVMQMRNEARTVDNMLKQMVSYLSDNSVSFLALRLLINIQEPLCQFYIQGEGKVDVTVLANAIKEMLEGPDDFEDWNDLDAVLRFYFLWWDGTPHSLAQKSTATLLEVTYRYAHKLPRAIATLRRQADIWRKDQKNWTSVAVLWSAIEQKLGVSDLTEVSHQDLANELGAYRQPVLLDVWRNMISPAFLILRQIHLERHPCWPNISEDVFDIAMGPRRVVPSGRVLSLCEKLVSLLYNDNENIYNETVECIGIVCQLDRYFWHSLSYKVRPNMTISCSYPLATSSTRLVFYRYYFKDNQGARSLRLLSLRDHLDLCRKERDDGECHELEARDHEILWLGVSSGERFSAIDHHAVFAGLDPNTGERQYLGCLARPSSLASFESLKLCLVPDGVQFVEYEDEQRVKKRSFQFHVLVLRFDPDIYPKESKAKLLKDICDPTGPLSWRPFSKHDRELQMQRLAHFTVG